MEITLGKSTGEPRAVVEARRGIYRDSKGDIIRTPEWRLDKIKICKAKLNDCQVRTTNLQNEINEHEQKLGIPLTEWNKNQITMWETFINWIKGLLQ